MVINYFKFFYFILLTNFAFGNGLEQKYFIQNPDQIGPFDQLLQHVFQKAYHDYSITNKNVITYNESEIASIISDIIKTYDALEIQLKSEKSKTELLSNIQGNNSFYKNFKQSISQVIISFVGDLVNNPKIRLEVSLKKASTFKIYYREMKQQVNLKLKSKIIADGDSFYLTPQFREIDQYIRSTIGKDYFSEEFHIKDLFTFSHIPRPREEFSTTITNAIQNTGSNFLSLHLKDDSMIQVEHPIHGFLKISHMTFFTIKCSQMYKNASFINMTLANQLKNLLGGVFKEEELNKLKTEQIALQAVTF